MREFQGNKSHQQQATARMLEVARLQHRYLTELELVLAISSRRFSLTTNQLQAFSDRSVGCNRGVAPSDGATPPLSKPSAEVRHDC